MRGHIEPSAVIEVDDVVSLLTRGRLPNHDETGWLVDVLESVDDDGLDYLAGQVECHTCQGGNVDDLLRTLRAVGRGKRARAAVELLTARAAEGAGDSTTAAAHITEALSRDPTLEPALHDAAQYAAARGDYVAADGYLRRAQTPNQMRDALDRVLAPVPGVPRNSPCPCGSGRKFKACCQRAAIHPLSERAPLVYALLGTYGERAPGRAVIVELAQRTAYPGQYANFCLDLTLFSGGLVDRFLAARGHWLRQDERDLIESWRAVSFSLYEVLDVRPGRGVTIRALPDGDPIYLADRLFSTSAQRLQLLCGRILHDGDGPCLLALPVTVPRHRRRQLQELLGTGPSMTELVDFFGPEPDPQVRNLDGHDVYDCRATYQVPNHRSMWDRLGEDLVQTGDDVLAWHRRLPDGRTLTLGEISRKGKTWTLTANSPQRLAELEQLLLDAAPSAKERSRHAERIGPEPDPAGREGRVMIFETYFEEAEPGLDEHQAGELVAGRLERSWLDQPVVDGLTPRQAAEAGGTALIELRSILDDIEAISLEAHRAGRSTDSLMNAGRLRHELGLAGDSRNP